MVTLKLTEDQQAAFDSITSWMLGSPKKRLTLGGLAGTGKTTLISHIVEFCRRRGIDVKILAPTAMAANVLTGKGVPASTIHSEIYIFKSEVVDEEARRRYINFDAKGVVSEDTTLYIVDEASMVTADLMADLESACPGKILYVGDHGQLAPVGRDPGLMREPDIRLETICRQAADSPIIMAAHAARETGRAPATGITDERLRVFSVFPKDVRKLAARCEADGIDQIICAFNKTRERVNIAYRRHLFGDDIDGMRDGDRLVCKLNNYKRGVVNGQIFNVDCINERLPDIHGAQQYSAMLSTPCGESRKSGTVINMAGVDEFKLTERQRYELTLKKRASATVVVDYAYALTCHAMQGSERARILVIDEPTNKWSMARWRYTAYTRAQNRLSIIKKSRR